MGQDPGQVWVPVSLGFLGLLSGISGAEPGANRGSQSLPALPGEALTWFHPGVQEQHLKYLSLPRGQRCGEGRQRKMEE